MFRRVALTGSAELFRKTSETNPDGRDFLREPAFRLGSEQVASSSTTYYQYSLTEAQVQTLVDALQKIKYPHNLKAATRLSMEDFDRLEALRQVLLDGLR